MARAADAKYKEKTAEINRRNSANSSSGNDLGPNAIDPDLQTKLREMLGGTMSPFNKKDGGVMTPGRQIQVLGLTSLLAERVHSRPTVGGLG